ncbi:proto-oncogene tyrosine-protein kinase ROS-like isoform X2 [Tigriopus californicus]|uniref:proto-oncogene tyrosine-protein kinase ROS-like isoform X2 n=1 Tax=Tigriopus californicus TaxID=6832 RepID=UPI0027DA183E|nr:proto-oncogene tyrosine-protein kinase ROS-like isoform X2 [Tigriopus californicus]
MLCSMGQPLCKEWGPLCFKVIWVLVVLMHSVQSDPNCLEICTSDLNYSSDTCSLSGGRCALCIQGCRSYQVGLAQGCESACNNTVHESFFELKKTSSCTLGCQGAIQGLLVQIQESKDFNPPHLISNSLGSTQLKLIWQPLKSRLGSDLGPQTTLLQIKPWKRGQTWQSLFEIHTDQNHLIEVTELEPFTRFQFRVAVSYSDQFPLIFSKPTPLIQTKPEGLPGAPTIVQVSEINNRHMTISWNPPEHPRNILSFYRLHITTIMDDQDKDPAQVIKDIPTSKSKDPAPFNYTTGPLEYGKRYQVEISAVNINGDEGERDAGYLQMSDQTTPNNAWNDYPFIYVSNGPDVYQKSLVAQELWDFAEKLFSISNPIRAMATHVKWNTVYLLDDQGSIWSNTTEIVMEVDGNILDIKVDWLFDHLIVISDQNAVHKCSLSTWQCHRHLARNARIQDLQVDPINGFIYWKETTQAGLGDDELWKFSECQPQPKKLYRSSALGSFTLDWNLDLVLIVDIAKNDLISIPLGDSNDVSPGQGWNMTFSTRRKPFESMSKGAMFTFNGSIYWTAGKVLNVLIEEEGFGHFHNSYEDKIDLSKAVFHHMSAQSVPFPLNPVTNVEVLFAPSDKLASCSTLAEIKWNESVNSESKCAWQHWNHTIRLTRNLSKETLLHNTSASSTNSYIACVQPEDLFNVSVQAFSSSGRSEWSKTTQSMSIPKLPLQDGSTNSVTLVWASLDQVFESDLLLRNISYKTVGFEALSVICQNGHTILSNGVSIRNGTQTLYDSLPRKSHDDLVSEPFSRSLYWSGANEIIRIDSNEILQIPALGVRSMAIDSDSAILCWNKYGTMIVCSGLFGTDERVVYNLGPWSSEIIVDLEIDPMSKSLIVMTTVRILKGHSVQDNNTPFESLTTIHEFESGQQRPRRLKVFLNKLQWLEGDHVLVTFDLKGHSLSRFQLGSSRVTDFCVQGLSLAQPEFPIVPIPVSEESIRVDENTSGNFVIKFETSSAHRSYDEQKLTYHVLLEFQSKFASFQTNEPSINLEPLSLTPGEKVKVSIISASNWMRSRVSQKSMFMPSKIASRPQHLRAFIHDMSQNESLSSLSILLRWSQPLLPNGNITGYRLTINNDDSLTKIIPSDKLEQVLIMEKGRGLRVGLSCENSAGLSEEASLVINNWLDLPSLPQVLLYENDNLTIYDLDLSIVAGSFDVGDISSLDFDGSLVFFTKTGGFIYSLDLLTGIKSRLLTSHMNGAFLQHLKIDWISKTAYFVNGRFLQKYTLTTEVLTNVVDLQGDAVDNVEIDPLRNTLYISEIHGGGFRLFQYNLNAFGVVKSKRVILGEDAQCSSCQEMDTGNPFHFTLKPNHEDKKPALVVLTNDGGLYTILADKSACECRFQRQIPAWSQISADRSNIYWQSHNRIQYLEANQGQIMDLIGITRSKEVLIRPYCQDCHVRPIGQCLRPTLISKQVVIEEVGENWIGIRLPKFRAPCVNSLPPIVYNVTYFEMSSDQERLSRNSVLVQIANDSPDQYQLRLQHLKAFTHYAIKVVSESFRKDPDESLVYARTAEGQPSEVQNVVASAIDPMTIRVSWNPPAHPNGKLVHYNIHYQLHRVISTSRLPTQNRQVLLGFSNARMHFNLTELEPDQEYSIWVEARTESPKISKSKPITVKTFKQINLPQTTSKTPRTLEISWRAPKIREIRNHRFKLTPRASKTSQYFPKSMVETQMDQTYVAKFTGLNPGIDYAVQIEVQFEVDIGNRSAIFPYTWPSNKSPRIVTTPPDAPLVPGQPYVMEDVAQAQVYLAWNSNHDLVEIYELEAKPYEPNKTLNGTTLNWSLVYNDADTKWPVSGLAGDTFVFRVRARNEFGWSNFSDVTSPIDVALIQASKGHLRTGFGKIVGVSAAGVAIVAVLLVLLIVMCIRRPWNKKIALGFRRDHELELATRRELPHMITGSNILEANPTYGIEIPTEQEINDIPKISRSHITCTNFIGSGAFGKVYEGIAKGLRSGDPNSTTTRVAIKMLGKNATNEERVKFLKEGLAMSMFKHPNIIHLIGICLDNNPPCLVLELMEGGDLLAYFKRCRDPGSQYKLTLADLGQICCDVAKGCTYLSDMQYIHRDIAARNCLVSSMNPQERVVKIGDFGLARDIYKDAYYRKNGQSLLPIKWMAPESLADNKYTIKSDVWSFGVLLWEIINLGRSLPYSSMTNLEVMTFVPNGGHPEIPPNCPERLKNLMLRCWAFHPDQRPEFKDCLQEVQELLVYQDELAEIPSFSQFNPSSRVNSTSNANSRDTWKTSGHSHLSQATTLPILRTQSSMITSPNYLQLLHESSPSQRCRTVPSTPNSSVGSCFSLQCPSLSESFLDNQYRQPVPLPRYALDPQAPMLLGAHSMMLTSYPIPSLERSTLRGMELGNRLLSAGCSSQSSNDQVTDSCYQNLPNEHVCTLPRGTHASNILPSGGGSTSA